ncbi:MAG: PQQ-like beta-propeller repeat protein [Armatimonadetes bacterium]|nr:PQQ-like beta-propeller repeat protein [Armatimonadota bacterium]
MKFVWCLLSVAVVGSAAAQLQDAPWPMEKQDRWGTGRALTGPDPSTYTTPWLYRNLSVGWVVAHGPALGRNGIGFYGSWNNELLNKFDFNTGAMLGSFDALNWTQATPAIGADGTVYMTTVAPFNQSPTARLFAVDPSTMDWIWHFPTFTRKQNDWDAASATIGPDGDIVVPSSIGKAWRLDGETGSVVWEKTGLGSAYFTIVFSRDDTKVFVSNGTRMTALLYVDGTEAWSLDFGSKAGAPAVAPNGTLVFGTDSGTIYGLHPDTGAVLWTFAALSNVRAAPSFAGDIAYVGSYDHRLYAIDVTDGSRQWSFTTIHELRNSPTVGHDGRIYLGTRTGHLYCVGPDGTEIWHVNAGSETRGQITVGPDATLYVGGPAPGGLAIIRQQEAVGPAESFSILRGLRLSGGLAELLDSDDSRLVVQTAVFAPSIEPPVQIEVVSTSPADTLTELRFRFEGMASRNLIERRISLYNYVTQSYEELHVAFAATSDEVVEIAVTTNASRFVEPGTYQMKALMTWKAAAVSFFTGWNVGIDQTIWHVVPAWIP